MLGPIGKAIRASISHSNAAFRLVVNPGGEQKDITRFFLDFPNCCHSFPQALNSGRKRVKVVTRVSEQAGWNGRQAQD